LRNSLSGNPDCLIIALRARPDLVTWIDDRCRDDTSLCSHNPHILPMTAVLTVEREAVSFNDLDKFSKRAFQAWHAIGNPIGSVLSEMTDRKSLTPHESRTKKGAFRLSNCVRVGSGSSMACST
jgi:hypothetical protein